MKSRRQRMVFMPLILVWIGTFCLDVIGQNVKVAVIGQSMQVLKDGKGKTKLKFLFLLAVPVTL